LQDRKKTLEYGSAKTLLELLTPAKKGEEYEDFSLTQQLDQVEQPAATQP